MIQVKHIKKVTIFLLLLVTAIGLVACNNKDKTPYEGIADANYAKVDDIEITRKDLYNNLRRQSANALNVLIEEKLLNGYKKTATELLESNDSNGEWAQTAFDEIVNQAIFSTTDLESIKNLKEDNLNTLVDRYVDNLYLANRNINADAVKTDLLTKLADNESDDFAKGYKSIEVLVDKYIIDIQKRLYAEEILDKVQTNNDTKNDDYIKEYQTINYYKSNVKGRTDTNVFYFHFLSTNEANAAFRMLNLKVNASGEWFDIPDIRTLNKFGNQTYVEEIVIKAGIDVKKLEQEDLENPGYTTVTESEYKKYYELYSPSSSKNTNADAPLTAEDVLDSFVELYNIVNTDQISVDSTPTNGKYGILNSDGSEYDGVRTYEELQKDKSALSDYIYNTLSDEKPYSTLRSVGTYRYLVFQLGTKAAEIDYVSADKDADNFEQWVTVEELNKILDINMDTATKAEKDKKANLETALKQLDVLNTDGTIKATELEKIMNDNKVEWKQELFKSKVTSSYANTKVAKLIEDEAKIEIYDSVVRALYNQSGSVTAKGKDQEGKVVLNFKISVKDNDKFADFDITVVELYNFLEAQMGTTSALDEIVNQMLLKEYNKADNGIFNGKKHDLNTKEFDKEYKTLIKNFSADQFASAGYPASMGREAFLLLMFGSTEKAEAIEKGFLVPQLRNMYTSGFDIIINEDNNIYNFLAKFTNNQRDNAQGIKVSHLLVYYDVDGDGTPEDPAEYLARFDGDQTALDNHYDLIEKLYDEIIKEAGKFDKLSTKLSSIVNEYQESARINLGFDEKEEWQEFRKAGLNIKFEDIGSEITNISNFPSAGSTLDPVFYDRAMQLYDRIMTEVGTDEELKAKLVGKEIQYLDMASQLTSLDNGLSLNEDETVADLIRNEQTIDGSEEYGIRSSFGYHFLLVNELTEQTSFKYDESKDYNKDYTFTEDNKEYSIYNTENDYIVESQIEYYVNGNKRKEGIMMPSAVKTSFTKYYEPVLTLFNNNFTKSAIFFNLVSEVKFQDDANQAVFTKLGEINEKQFNGYITDNDKYTSLYGQWFTELKNIY